MKETDEIITIRVEKSKAKAFRDMLKLFNFIKLETLDEKLDRYINMAPKNVALTDDDILDVMKAQ